MAATGSGLFVSAISGLSSTYAALAKGKTGGLSLDDLTTNLDSSSSLNNANYSFISYLTNNFGNLDKDGDGKITAQDINNLTQKISTQGMTYEEIVQLCGSGYGTSLMNTVLTYFDEIDKNKDGRITDAEIKAYNIEADRMKMELEYNSYNPNDASLFYSDDTDFTPSSLLEYKYPKNNT